MNEKENVSNPETSHRITTSGDIEVSTYLEIAKEMTGQQPVPVTESTPALEHEAIVVLDFGSQYSMLITRRIRECNVYCELVPYDTPWEKIETLNPKGLILSGGPASVYDKNSPQAPSYVFEKKLPVLGICYGMQLIVRQMGGKVSPGKTRECHITFKRPGITSFFRITTGEYRLDESRR